jgi:hypothetical protein
MPRLREWSCLARKAAAEIASVPGASNVSAFGATAPGVHSSRGHFYSGAHATPAGGGVNRRARAARPGRLKHEWALLPLRVRGLDRVRLHADLTILAKLTTRLATERALPLAA